ncbi:MAG: DoxX family protein [Paracoccaceae bacterium]
MNTPLFKYGLPAVKALLSLAFIAAGLAKLSGVEMMVGTFEAVGVGQWFRYVTGGIEIIGAVLIWLPNRQAIGAAMLTVTMAGAVMAHFLILGPSALPAIILGLLSAVTLYAYRDQITGTATQPA